MNNIVSVKLDSRYASTLGVWQYDYGQVLRITGPELPPAVEVQFSLDEKSGETLSRVGTTVDGVTEVKIPDELLTHSATSNYRIYAYIYLTDETSGNTKYEITIPVRVRSKPTSPAEDPETDPDLFRETVVAVNASAERAKMAEQNAKESATEAGKYAASASESAVTAENTKEDALRKVGEKKREAIEAIQNQEETSVGKITTHTDGEIQRIQNQATDSKAGLEQTITNADASKKELEHSIETAGTSKTALDKSVKLAGTAKTELDTSTLEAGTAKTALDESTEAAGTVQETLSATVNQAGALDTSLGEKIKTGTQLKTDLVTSGEKAVQDIQTAGSEQLGKMQTVADEFEADREQVNVNKENIASLTEDTAALKDGKISKFYASSQGETHLADSDKGLVQDIKIYGQSEQSSTTGAQLFNENIEIKNRGVTIKINGSTATFKGTVSDEANARVNYQKNIKLKPGKYTASSSNEKIKADFLVEKANNEVIYNNHIEIDGTEKEVKIRVLFGLEPSAKGDVINETTNIMLNDGDIALPYEPYTGGQPSPNPDYPQEIKSIVNPVVKVCGKNIMPPGLKLHNRVKCYIKKGKITIVAKDGFTSNGGNIVFYDNNNNRMWLGFSKGNKKATAVLPNDAYSFEYVLEDDFESKNVCLVIGDNDIYVPYHAQTVQLPYTLNAIPVTSGGNVTIGGQQYIADRVVEKDGVFGIERNIREIHTNTKTMNNSEGYPGWNKVEGITDVIYYNEISVGTSRILTFISNFTQSALCQNNIESNEIVFLIRDDIGYSQSELIAKAIDVDMYIRLQDAIFEPLPGYIQAKLRTLVTNYPVTNISVTSDQLDGYTVFNYPISMANGWNYVKQQINDNRDYIYDMDLQSAEAYVNSEYAVALTELEVM